MKRILIKDFLNELGYSIEDINLGKFDEIGEITAKKKRSPTDPLYHSRGAYFRPNLERGILLSFLIKKFSITNILEIGFGRGYSTLCCASTFCDLGLTDAKITTIDPNLDQNQVEGLTKIFPKEWFSHIQFIKATSREAKEKIEGFDEVQLVYVDGDHRYSEVLHDWEWVKNRFTKFVLFDDYHEKNKIHKDMEVSQVVDAIEGYEKRLLITDRRIFLDDRLISDDQINYGQVLVKAPNFDTQTYLGEW